MEKKNIEMTRSTVDLYVGLKSGEYIVVDYDFRNPHYHDYSLHEVVKNIERFKLWTSTKDGYISDTYYSIDGKLIHQNELVKHFFGE